MAMKKINEKADEAELRRNPVNVFQCGHADCQKIDALVAPLFMKHLLDVHGIAKDQMKGKKQMLAHIDGSYWYSYEYKWTLECGLTFGQYIRAARSKTDLMRY
jgi:hypothetical protein